MTDDEMDAARDAAIETTIEAIQNFVQLHRGLWANRPSIDFERFMLGWISEILLDVGIDAERAVQSLHDDGLGLHDDPNLGINWQFKQRNLRGNQGADK